MNTPQHRSTLTIALCFIVALIEGFDLQAAGTAAAGLRQTFDLVKPHIQRAGFAISDEVSARKVHMRGMHRQPQTAGFAQIHPLTVISAPVGQYCCHEFSREVVFAPR